MAQFRASVVSSGLLWTYITGTWWVTVVVSTPIGKSRFVLVYYNPRNFSAPTTDRYEHLSYT